MTNDYLEGLKEREKQLLDDIRRKAVEMTALRAEYSETQWKIRVLEHEQAKDQSTYRPDKVNSSPANGL